VKGKLPHGAMLLLHYFQKGILYSCVGSVRSTETTILLLVCGPTRVFDFSSHTCSQKSLQDSFVVDRKKNRTGKEKRGKEKKGNDLEATPDTRYHIVTYTTSLKKKKRRRRYSHREDMVRRRHDSRYTNLLLTGQGKEILSQTGDIVGRSTAR
jgi:hypothetical protein